MDKRGKTPSADVVVVGGGIVGTSLAYELACAGGRVALIDARHPGRASDAGAGIVSPETLLDADDAWCEFASTAAEHLRTLVVRLADDGADPGPEALAQCGSLALALAEHEDPWFCELVDRAAARSSPVAEVSADEARRMFPPLGRVWRALHNPRALRVDGRRVTSALRGAAQSRGVVFVDGEANGVDRSGDRVTAVRLGANTIPCGAVVVAGGAWSADWAECLHAPLPVGPTKGQIVHVVSPRPDAADSAQWPIVQPVLNFYLVPWPGGRVACGGTFEGDAGFDVRPTAAGLRDLLRECVAIAPGLGDATFSEVRVGLRPTSADGRPLLGTVPGWANAHVCTGHGAEGLMLGPYSAALVAASIFGDRSPSSALYSPVRFCR